MIVFLFFPIVFLGKCVVGAYYDYETRHCHHSNFVLRIVILKALIWPVITYGAEGWTLKKDDERRLEAAEMWCYRRMLRISWTEKRTNKSILNELQTGRELLAQIIKRKMAFFGHACRNNKCTLVKTCILGMMSGKRRRGVLGCNTLITSRNGQGHPWKKT